MKNDKNTLFIIMNVVANDIPNIKAIIHPGIVCIFHGTLEIIIKINFFFSIRWYYDSRNFERKYEIIEVNVSIFCKLKMNKNQLSHKEC